jgi:hypothetical protein
MRGVLSRPEVGGQSACSDRKLKQTFAASVPNDEVGWKRRWGACSPSVGSILFIRPPQFMSRKRMNANAPLPAAIDGLLSPAGPSPFRGSNHCVLPISSPWCREYFVMPLSGSNACLVENASLFVCSSSDANPLGDLPLWPNLFR